MAKFVLVSADDWAGLYVDGYLVHEGHSISGQEVLEYGDLDFESYEVDYEWMNDQGRLPDDVDDIPDNVRLHY